MKKKIVLYNPDALFFDMPLALIAFTEEFTYWNAKYNFTDINFHEETFFTRRKRVMEIAEGLIENNINTTWAGTLCGDQAKSLS